MGVQHRWRRWHVGSYGRTRSHIAYTEWLAGSALFPGGQENPSTTAQLGTRGRQRGLGLTQGRRQLKLAARLERRRGGPPFNKCQRATCTTCAALYARCVLQDMILPCFSCRLLAGGTD